MNVELPHVLLVAVDYGPSSPAALAMGVALAQRFSAQLALAHVSAAQLPEHAPASNIAHPRDHQLYTLTRKEAEADLKRFAESLVPTELPTSTAVLFGPPETELLKYAQQVNAGWLVVGTRHKHGLERALLGSVAEYLLRHSRIPVLVVPKEHAQ